MTADVVIEDDGPIIDIGLSGAGLDLDMDESIVLPQSTSDEGGTIAPGPDDVGGVTAPGGGIAFGRKTSAMDEVADLFSDVLVDPGTDGDDRTDVYTLSLADAAGALATVPATDFDIAGGFDGVQSTMSVSTPVDPMGDATIYLFWISATVIEGRVDIDGTGIYDDVALKVTILDGTTADPKVKVEQILAIDHGSDGNDHDSLATLGVAGTPVVPVE